MKKTTVLVVEDEPPLRNMVAQIMAQEGYDVLEAGSGEEALSVSAGRDVDLLLSDVIMPGMSGPELLLRLRDRGGVRHFLFMSGYPAECLQEVTQLSRHTPLLPKPFTAAQLVHSIQRVFSIAEARKQPESALAAGGKMPVCPYPGM